VLPMDGDSHLPTVIIIGAKNIFINKQTKLMSAQKKMKINYR
jgi:hypothetical protein